MLFTVVSWVLFALSLASVYALCILVALAIYKLIIAALKRIRFRGKYYCANCRSKHTQWREVETMWGVKTLLCPTCHETKRVRFPSTKSLRKLDNYI